MPPSLETPSSLPPTVAPAISKFGSGRVSAKKVFILGIFIIIVGTPLVGAVYSLAFIFNKETRKEGITLLIWTIVWGLIGFFAAKWLAIHGVHVPGY